MAYATREPYLKAPVRWADVGESKIAYRRFGDGPALLLVHGFPLSGYTWRKVLPELSKRFTCYAIDLPGLGETEWTSATDFSFPGQGLTLKAFVDAVELGRFSVLAHDTGGTFARYLALADVSRVERLFLINTEMPGHRPPWIPLYQFLMRLPGTPGTLQTLMRSRAYLRSPMGFGGCFCDLSLIDGEFHDHFIKPVLTSKTRVAGIREYLIGAKWGPVDALEQKHAKLTMPVRLIWGMEDPTFPLPLARKMLPQFPNADLVEIPGAKLLPHEEKPDDVVRAVLELAVQP